MPDIEIELDEWIIDLLDRQAVEWGVDRDTAIIKILKEEIEKEKVVVEV